MLRSHRTRRDTFAEDPSFGPDPVGLVDFDAGRGGAYTSLGCATAAIGLVAVGLGVLLWSVAAIGTLFQGWESPTSACDFSSNELVRVAHSGDEAKVRAFLAQGADANTRDDKGTSAVGCAAEGQHHGLVMLLLRAGATADGIAEADRPSLMTYLVDRDDADGIQLLFNRQAVAHESLDVPLVRAASHTKLAALRELIEHGADPAAGLRQAVDTGDLAATKSLLLVGTDPHGVGTGAGFRTYSPLLRAVFERRGDIVEELLLAGADPNDGGEIGQAPFDLAITAVAARNPTDRLSGLDTAVMTFPGNLPPLVAAAANGDALMVDRLLLAGADPNRIGFDRFAPLHGAVLGGDVVIVKRLLDAGADTTPVLPTGAPSPVELATTTGQPDIVAVLVAAGPK